MKGARVEMREVHGQHVPVTILPPAGEPEPEPFYRKAGEVIHLRDGTRVIVTDRGLIEAAPRQREVRRRRFKF